MFFESVNISIVSELNSDFSENLNFCCKAKEGVIINNDFCKNAAGVRCNSCWNDR